MNSFQQYMDCHKALKVDGISTASNSALFKDFNNVLRILAHPSILAMNKKDEINNDTSSESESENDSNDEDSESDLDSNTNLMLEKSKVTFNIQIGSL